MIVGAEMTLRGSVEGDCDVTVRGRVEGEIRIGGVLTVEPGGVVQAEVEARAVAVYGTLWGNARARERIEVARTGQMAGDATAPEVAILPGAVFRGRVEMGPAPEPVELAPAERSALPRGQQPPPPPEPEPPREREVPRLAVPARVPLRRRPSRP